MKSLKIGQYEIKYPIFQGGMGLGISWDQLAGNVSLNGCLGIISSVGTGCYKGEIYAQKVIKNRPVGSDNFYSTAGLKAIIENARKICGNLPLGVNIMYAANDYARMVKDACESGINIIVSGAGLPTNLPEFTQNFKNVALVPIVSSAKALKIICKRWTTRYNKLPDAVVLEGPKSGGHQGFTYEQCTDPDYQLENLIPQVKDEIKNWGDFPLIAAGGIWDKNDIDKMMSLGANGVQMGTRFIGTYECDAAIGFKEILMDAKQEDIGLLKSPVGYPARGVKTNLFKLMEEKIAPKIQCICNCVSPCERGIGAKKVGFCIAERLHDAALGIKETGLFFTGTNGYKIKELISVKELIKRLIEGEK